MKKRSVSLLCAPLLALAACDVEPGINAPDAEEAPVGVQDVLMSTTGCQDGWEYKWPDALGTGVAYDPDFIQMSCGPHPDYFGTEWCSSLSATVTLAIKNGYDHAIFTCDGQTRTLMSNGWTPEGIIILEPHEHSCWNCLGNCATQGQCPAGATDCYVVPGNSAGSDCRPVYCGPAHENWQVVDNFPYMPQCRRRCEEPPPPPPPPPQLTVDIDGPTLIPPGATCTWTATASTTGVTFNWYNENHWDGAGVYYTGSRPNGTINPWFRVRLEGTTGQQWASKEITVYEDPSAPMCVM